MLEIITIAVLSNLLGLAAGILLNLGKKPQQINVNKELTYLADQVCACKNRLDNMETTNSIYNDKIICLLKDFKEAENDKIIKFKR